MPSFWRNNIVSINIIIVTQVKVIKIASIAELNAAFASNPLISPTILSNNAATTMIKYAIPKTIDFIVFSERACVSAELPIAGVLSEKSPLRYINFITCKTKCKSRIIVYKK